MLKDTKEVLTEDEKILRDHQLFLLKQRREKLDAKRIEYADRQRQKRADERALGVVRARPKPLRVEVVEPDENPDLPGRRAWSHVAPRKVKKKQAPAPAPALPGKSFVNGVWSTVLGGEKPAESLESFGELPLDNLEVTPPPFKGFESLIKTRVKCRETAAFLLLRANRQGDIGKPLFKAATKLSNCSLWGLFQSINSNINYKIGTALCKCRLCPNCQRVLSAKRKANFIDWFLLNAKQLRPYFFYHMVLTVRHSMAEGVRTGFYVPDMLLYFAQLRGTCSSLSGAQQRERSRIWKEFVAGGAYSLEVKPAGDGSPNVHIHCLLVARKQLTNEVQDSEFLKHVKPLWKQITGDSENIFVKKVYYKDEAGKEHIAFKGSDLNIEAAVAECMKYTVKADSESLAGFSDEFLIDLLSLKKRYYARFGCLSSNDKDSKKFLKMDMLAGDFKDLDRLTDKELARLFDPETGEIIDKEATSILVAPFRNMEPKPALPGPLVQRAVVSDWTPDRLRVARPATAQEVADMVQGLASELVIEKKPKRKQGGRVLPASSKLVPSGSYSLTLGWADKDFKYGGEAYYSLKPSPLGENQFFPPSERDRAAVLLSRSISADYGQPYDLQEVLDIEAQKGT